MPTRRDLAAPMSKTRTITRDWVDCPICGGTDMRKETDEHGDALIFCVNHACGSNGGNNFVAVEAMFRPKDYETIRSAEKPKRSFIFPSAGIGRRITGWAKRKWTR